MDGSPEPIENEALPSPSGLVSGLEDSDTDDQDSGRDAAGIASLAVGLGSSATHSTRSTGVKLRRIGSRSGHAIQRPNSWAELLEKCRSRLGIEVATVYNEHKDIIGYKEDGDIIGDIELVCADSVLYIGGEGEEWRPAELSPVGLTPQLAAGVGAAGARDAAHDDGQSVNSASMTIASGKSATEWQQRVEEYHRRLKGVATNFVTDVLIGDDEHRWRLVAFVTREVNAMLEIFEYKDEGDKLRLPKGCVLLIYKGGNVMRDEFLKLCEKLEQEEQTIWKSTYESSFRSSDIDFTLHIDYKAIVDQHQEWRPRKPRLDKVGAMRLVHQLSDALVAVLKGIRNRLMNDTAGTFFKVGTLQQQQQALQQQLETTFEQFKGERADYVAQLPRSCPPAQAGCFADLVSLRCLDMAVPAGTEDLVERDEQADYELYHPVTRSPRLRPGHSHSKKHLFVSANKTLQFGSTHFDLVRIKLCMALQLPHGEVKKTNGEVIDISILHPDDQFAGEHEPIRRLNGIASEPFEQLQIELEGQEVVVHRYSLPFLIEDLLNVLWVQHDWP